ncbi:hypothetical protein M422DRAFT_271455 [Sphaerobolus stellatus SS14]|uniref:Uncharacterized protein n=1 Tax=Sphaerobolus stellatus (strain SS14) TaxID=990650 RepID=A0A0C9UEI0_SPHS4|nr:hypothetical protein M422DRAFT_271455 [Sphaerobolus stellatus SS14]
MSSLSAVLICTCLALLGGWLTVPIDRFMSKAYKLNAEKTQGDRKKGLPGKDSNPGLVRPDGGGYGEDIKAAAGVTTD